MVNRARKVTWVDAAARVLQDAHEPLTPNMITSRALRLKLVQPKKSANIQMAASIKVSIDGALKTGKKPRFFSIGKGKYGLTEWLRGQRTTYASLAYWILKSEQKEMHYEKIADRILKAKGLKRMPANFTNNIHVSLNYDGRFKLVGRGVFGLKRWNVPPPIKYNDRFTFSRPTSFHMIFQVIYRTLKGARNLVKVCTPYIDKTTFENILKSVPPTAEIQLLIGDKDNRWSEKVREGMNSSLISSFAANRQIFVARIENLHSRFVIADDSTLLILSADLQRDQCSNKNQYAFLTSNKKIVRGAINYYHAMWNDAKPSNLAREARLPKKTATTSPTRP